MDVVFGDWAGHAELDYVAAWFVKATAFIKGTSVPVSFVSTNSITQGEQVSLLWPRLIAAGLRFHFAHRTFQWSNDAPGPASVASANDSCSSDLARPISAGFVVCDTEQAKLMSPIAFLPDGPGTASYWKV